MRYLLLAAPLLPVFLLAGAAYSCGSQRCQAPRDPVPAHQRAAGEAQRAHGEVRP